MLDLVDEALDQMALFVQMTVVLALFFATWRGGDDRFGATLNNQIKEISRIIGLICDNVFGAEALDERRRLGDVVTLTSCQSETQWIAQAIDADVDLGAETATTPSQGLLSLTACFFGRQLRKDERG